MLLNKNLAIDHTMKKHKAKEFYSEKSQDK